jgi:hypothetical protein
VLLEWTLKAVSGIPLAAAKGSGAARGGQAPRDDLPNGLVRHEMTRVGRERPFVCGCFRVG